MFRCSVAGINNLRIVYECEYNICIASFTDKRTWKLWSNKETNDDKHAWPRKDYRHRTVGYTVAKPCYHCAYRCSADHNINMFSSNFIFYLVSSYTICWARWRHSYWPMRSHEIVACSQQPPILGIVVNTLGTETVGRLSYHNYLQRISICAQCKSSPLLLNKYTLFTEIIFIIFRNV